MSEERRKRQQERVPEATPQSRNKLILGGVVVLFVLAYAAGWYHSNHRYDGFAKCLASKQAKMYGLYWCPHCIEQKEMFGRAFQYVPYTECAIKGSRELTAGVQGGWTEAVSELAVWRESAEGGCLPLAGVER